MYSDTNGGPTPIPRTFDITYARGKELSTENITSELNAQGIDCFSVNQGNEIYIVNEKYGFMQISKVPQGKIMYNDLFNQPIISNNGDKKNNAIETVESVLEKLLVKKEILNRKFEL